MLVFDGAKNLLIFWLTLFLSNILLATSLDIPAPKPHDFKDTIDTKDGFLKKDINYYLNKNDALLWRYYMQVIQQSKTRDYPIYKGRYIIDAKSYIALSKNAKEAFRGQIVFASIVLDNSNKPLNYSELGGISIRGILAQDIDDRNAKKYFFKLDSRYYSDLEVLDKNRRIYLYCILPTFSSCIMLGIHEAW